MHLNGACMREHHANELVCMPFHTYNGGTAEHTHTHTHTDICNRTAQQGYAIALVCQPLGRTVLASSSISLTHLLRPEAASL